MAGIHVSQPVPGVKAVPLSVITWTVVLLASDLPNALWQTLGGDPPGWLFWVRTGFLMAVVLLSLAWRRLQPLRIYFILLLVLMIARWSMDQVMATPEYDRWQKQAGWVLAMGAFELLKVAVTAVMLGALLVVGRRPADFFLAKGDLKAPVEPVRWLGIRRDGWGKFGPVLAVVLVLATVLFFGLTGGFASLGAFGKGWPLLFAAVVLAALNAFNEEMQFRAPFLSPLSAALGRQHAIWLTAVFFGFSHYFGGSPSGVPGVLITALLGFFFAKAMLETRGLGWGWFIHFLQNAVIFSFLALSAV